MREPGRLHVALRNAVIAMVLAVGAALAARGLAPFLAAAFLAVLIDPLVDWGERRGISRSVGAAAALLTLLVLLGWLAGAAAFHLVAELERLMGTAWGSETGGQWLAEVSRFLRSEGGSQVREGLLRLIAAAGGAARSVPNLLLGVAAVVIGAYLMARDKRRLWAALRRWTPAAAQLPASRFGARLARDVTGLVRAELLLAGITAGLAVLVLSLAGVAYAWLLGLVAGFLDLMPLVGPAVVLFPTALYLAASGAMGRALAVAGGAALVIGLRELFEPRIVGAGAGLHPLATLLAVYLGVRVLGPVGVIAGPLAVVVFSAVCEVTVAPWLEGE